MQWLVCIMRVDWGHREIHWCTSILSKGVSWEGWIDTLSGYIGVTVSIHENDEYRSGM